MIPNQKPSHGRVAESAPGSSNAELLPLARELARKLEERATLDGRMRYVAALAHNIVDLISE